MKVFYILLNLYLPYYSYVISTCIRTNGSISTFGSTILFSSPTNLIYGSIFQMYFGYLFFQCQNNLHLLLFLNSLSFCFVLTPSSKVMWFLWLYLLLNCSIFEVMWFLSLNFLLLSCSTRPCFYLFILAQYLYTYWTTINEIWKILLINVQLVPQNSFISFMLKQILFQLLRKIFLHNLPPFLALKSFVLFFVLIRVQYYSIYS